MVFANSTTCLSGVIATGPDGQLAGDNSPALKAETCSTNIAAILTAVGGTVDNVLQNFCVATHPDAGHAYPAERNGRMTLRPAAMTVLAFGLQFSGAMIEVEISARIPA